MSSTELDAILYLSSPFPSTNQLPKMATNAGAADSDPVVDILFALHDKFDFMDFAGPLEVVTTALHKIEDACMYLQ